MHLVRGGRGPAALARALASQVHPVFMLPPVAASWFGSALAGEFAVPLAALHSAAIFCAVYTAHVKDGYVDFHVRDEDDDHPLTRPGCRLALAGATAAFAACLAGLWLLAGVGAAAVTLPTWVIGFLHAPQLDTSPAGATLGYPVGIGVTIAGAHYVQAGAFGAAAFGFAAVFVVLLAGVKVVDDAQDYAYDLTIEKRTVAVVVGRERARSVAFGLMVLALAMVAGLVAAGLFPPGSLVAALAFGLVAAFARNAGPERATMLLVRGAYVFLALLVAAVWYRPLR